MATIRPQTPLHDHYTTVPQPTNPSHLSRGYGNMEMGSGSQPNNYMTGNDPIGHSYDGNSAVDGGIPDASPLPHSARFNEDFDASQRGSSVLEDSGIGTMRRTNSQMSQTHPQALSRGGTLKKKQSLSRKSSLKRSGSRRSSRAGSVRSLALGDREKYGSIDGEDPSNSAFYVPIPTSGSPTEALASRFQAWRKVLKDLIAFFRDIQKSYETRSKLLMQSAHVLNNIQTPGNFLASGGLADATEILKDHHKQALIEANKAREVETEVIAQLTGLRSDLQQKTKEIKSLSGDFKNNVDKEVENTRKTVRHLQESLGLIDTDPAAASGKGDPYIVKLGVERQVEKQIEEENYLHRAYLNLESSGRELESIVVGEIQKAYNAYASILRRDADVAYDTAERLRDGPISMPKDFEWGSFVAHNDDLVDPSVPVRNFETISYPGRDHPATAEVRSGMLERKSKYLKSYTPGWYVLSPTHLHEFKSADRISAQQPVMSLYLPEQKLGSHSQGESSSHKFMLKGRQTGAMHRGHAWVFRAESFDTMLAWYEDIKVLTEKTGEARDIFVRNHTRSLSGGSFRRSISDDGAMEEDEADETPYSADAAVMNHRPPATDTQWQRPQPGGRFPSDVQLSRDLQVPLSPSSGESATHRDVAAAAAQPGSGLPFSPYQQSQPLDNRPDDVTQVGSGYDNGLSPRPVDSRRPSANYADWLAPVAAGAAGAAGGQAFYDQYQAQKQPQQYQPEEPQYLQQGAGNESYPPQETQHSTYSHTVPNAAVYVNSVNGQPAGPQANEPTRSMESAANAEAGNASGAGGTTEPSTAHNMVNGVPAVMVATNNSTSRSAEQQQPPKEEVSPITDDAQQQYRQQADNMQGAYAIGDGSGPTSPVSPLSPTSPNSVPSPTSTTRPTPQSHDSWGTVSDLHVPGGYPSSSR